jgi:hypothetical protein
VTHNDDCGGDENGDKGEQCDAGGPAAEAAGEKVGSYVRVLFLSSDCMRKNLAQCMNKEYYFMKSGME